MNFIGDQCAGLGHSLELVPPRQGVIQDDRTATTKEQTRDRQAVRIIPAECPHSSTKWLLHAGRSLLRNWQREEGTAQGLRGE